MKKILEFVKKRPIEFGGLFIMLILLNSASMFIFPMLWTFITVHIPAPWHAVRFEIVKSLIALTGIAVITLRMGKGYNKMKLLLKLLVLGILALLIYLGFFLAMEFLSKIIYNSITGSIATAMVIIDSVVPIFKLSIDAFLLCILGNVINYHRILCRISVKKYFKILLACLVLLIIQFLLLMLPNGPFLIISNNVISAVAITLLVAIALYQKEEVNYEKD